jgi:hypothetical protein
MDVEERAEQLVRDIAHLPFHAQYDAIGAAVRTDIRERVEGRGLAASGPLLTHTRAINRWFARHSTELRELLDAQDAARREEDARLAAQPAKIREHLMQIARARIEDNPEG